MSLSQAAPEGTAAGLGWPKTAQWTGPLGWPATTVPRETISADVTVEVAEKTAALRVDATDVVETAATPFSGETNPPFEDVTRTEPDPSPSYPEAHRLAGEPSAAAERSEPADHRATSSESPSVDGGSDRLPADRGHAPVDMDAATVETPQHEALNLELDPPALAGSSGDAVPRETAAPDGAVPELLGGHGSSEAAIAETFGQATSELTGEETPELVDDTTSELLDDATPERVGEAMATPTTDDVDPVIVRPPGPRRAKFDRDEFDNPSVDTEEGPGPARAANRVHQLPRPAMPRVFVVANQKGGVGKTTTSVNLAAGLALGGLNVVVIDLDPQGNASTALGIDHPPGTPGTYEVLIEDAAISDHLVDSPEAPSLRVLPATIDLAGAEIQLVSKVARENRLRRALRTFLAEQDVDYVFLDCPPSLGLITLNALVAAGEILIPIQCEYYALEGVSQLVRTINLVKGELNENLEVTTVLLTMYDARTRLAAQVADEVRAYFTEQTLPTVIPRSVRISEAPSYGQTVLTYHPDSAGAVSYLEAAHEIARRGAKENA